MDLIGEILQKGQVRSIRNRCACMITCMNVDGARGACMDHSQWRSVLSAFFPWSPMGKRLEFMYVLYLLIGYNLEKYHNTHFGISIKLSFAIHGMDDL